MSMIEDYLREVETSLRADPARKRQIVDELRTHLSEKVADVSAADPARSALDIEQEVLREFGNPRDLALAYEPEGTAVLRNAAGDTVLQIGKAVGRGAAAVGRGTGKALKWIAVGCIALLLISVGVGAWAYYEVKPLIPSIIEQSQPAYDYSQQCAQTPCSGSPPADAFFVRNESQTVRLQLDVYRTHAPNDWDTRLGNGTVRVNITDSAGNVRYDRTIDLSNESRVDYQSSWAAIPGEWNVAYTFDGFVGQVRVQVYSYAIPWDEDR